MMGAKAEARDRVMMMIMELSADIAACTARAQDLHLCAVVDSLRATKAILKTEAKARLNVDQERPA